MISQEALLRSCWGQLFVTSQILSEVLAIAVAIILYVSQLKLREVKGCVQSHTATKHGELALEPRQSNAMLTLRPDSVAPPSQALWWPLETP